MSRQLIIYTIKRMFINYYTVTSAIFQIRAALHGLVIFVFLTREMRRERKRDVTRAEDRKSSARVARGRRLWHAPTRAHTRVSFSPHVSLPNVCSTRERYSSLQVPRLRIIYRDRSHCDHSRFAAAIVTPRAISITF